MPPSCGSTCRASQRRDDFHPQLGDAIDARVQLVARLHRSHTGRRAGEDEIARLERVVLRQIGDLFWHRPDHVGKIGALALLAVDVEPNRPARGMADLRRGDELAAGGGFVEVLAEVPGPPVVLAPLLQIAARHVQADRVAKDEIVGAAHVDAPAALAERDNELGLVVVVRSLRRVMHFTAARDERVLALQEEKRLLAAVAAHLLLMLGVVAPDAENAAYRKLIGTRLDRQRRRGPQGNCVGHQVPRKPAILFRVRCRRIACQPDTQSARAQSCGTASSRSSLATGCAWRSRRCFATSPRASARCRPGARASCSWSKRIPGSPRGHSPRRCGSIARPWWASSIRWKSAASSSGAAAATGAPTACGSPVPAACSRSSCASASSGTSAASPRVSVTTHAPSCLRCWRSSRNKKGRTRRPFLAALATTCGKPPRRVPRYRVLRARLPR